jgi:hypothetical protein
MNVIVVEIVPASDKKKQARQPATSGFFYGLQ